MLSAFGKETNNVISNSQLQATDKFICCLWLTHREKRDFERTIRNGLRALKDLTNISDKFSLAN